MSQSRVKEASSPARNHGAHPPFAESPKSRRTVCLDLFFSPFQPHSSFFQYHPPHSFTAIYRFLGSPLFWKTSNLSSGIHPRTFAKMHFATRVHHHATRARTKSVQFGKSVMSLDSADTASSRDEATSPPTPGTRTSSLPLSDKKENINPIRHYRSLLDFEDAPRLPHFKPLCYDELYPRPTESMAVHKAPLLRMPLHS